MNINEVLSKLIILQSQGVRQIYIKEKPVMITKLINDLHLIKIQKTHDLIHYFEFIYKLHTGYIPQSKVMFVLPGGLFQLLF